MGGGGVFGVGLVGFGEVVGLVGLLALLLEVVELLCWLWLWL